MEMHEVFLGALPRAPAMMAAVEAGLHVALVAFASSPDVRIRLHTKESGEGRGFGFAWLPDATTARRLVEATEIYFTVDGVAHRCGIRAARGRPAEEPQRPPPSSSDPGQLGLRVTFLALSQRIDCALVVASFNAWNERLRRFGIGLELQRFFVMECVFFNCLDML
jgi:hypothetical protein